MKSRDFVYWLQGFFEMGGADNGITPAQAAMIKRHLGLVFQNDSDMAVKPQPVRPADLYPATPKDFPLQTSPVPFPNQSTIIC